MSKTFKVPVLIKIKAASQEEADKQARRFMGNAGEFSINYEPELHKTIAWWELADAAIKPRKSK